MQDGSSILPASTRSTSQCVAERLIPWAFRSNHRSGILWCVSDGGVMVSTGCVVNDCMS